MTAFSSVRIRASGPCPAQIMLVGEAPGRDELLTGRPFTGASGKELRRMLDQAGIDMDACYLSNVFMSNPEKNDVNAFTAKRNEVPKDYTLPPLSTGHYVLPEHLHELDRLRGEIAACSPSLIIALGNTATWALLRRTGIGKLRGAVFRSDNVLGECPVLSTYHPAAVLRQWENRVVVVQDFIKAKRYVDEGGFSVPRRELWLDPTMEEFEEFVRRYILDDDGRALCGKLAFDIETLGETITCIGFAPSKDRSITVPFYDPRRPGGNYWPDLAGERRAWLLVKRVLESNIPKLGQNGLYDLQYLLRYGVRVHRYEHDSMIRHHALFPELEKGLGFLGSIYTDEAPWKLMRPRNKDNYKADDE